MAELKEGSIYFVDGGYFKAKYDIEQACWRLWVYAGYSGQVIARNGFEIGEEGELVHRIYDVIGEEYVYVVSGLVVGDLEEVGAGDVIQP